jgi:hypothetical protein
MDNRRVRVVAGDVLGALDELSSLSRREQTQVKQRILSGLKECPEFWKGVKQIRDLMAGPLNPTVS